MTTKQELNRQSAEKFGKIKKNINGYLIFEINGITFESQLCDPDSYILWNPAEKNSGQIFLVLKAIKKLGFNWELKGIGEGYDFFIYFKGSIVSSKYVTDDKELNETILRCILEAFEKKEVSDERT